MMSSEYFHNIQLDTTGMDTLSHSAELYKMPDSLQLPRKLTLLNINILTNISIQYITSFTQFA